MKIVWILIAFTAGAVQPIQAAFNTRLGKSIENPIYAAMISFVVGAVGLIVYALLTKQQVSWQGLRQIPGYVWLSGILGAFYVTAIILAFPRIGPALTFGLIVAGQMIMAVIAEHFKIFVPQQHAFNVWRLLGVVLIITGVFIIRKF